MSLLVRWVEARHSRRALYHSIPPLPVRRCLFACLTLLIPFPGAYITPSAEVTPQKTTRLCSRNVRETPSASHQGTHISALVLRKEMRTSNPPLVQNSSPWDILPFFQGYAIQIHSCFQNSNYKSSCCQSTSLFCIPTPSKIRGRKWREKINKSHG